MVGQIQTLLMGLMMDQERQGDLDHLDLPFPLYHRVAQAALGSHQTAELQSNLIY